MQIHFSKSNKPFLLYCPVVNISHRILENFCFPCVAKTGCAWKIITTRLTGGLHKGYKPIMPTRVSRRGLSLCSSLLPLPLLPPLKGRSYYLLPLKGSSYSRTLSLSIAMSCFSCSSIYFLIVASFIPTVDT